MDRGLQFYPIMRGGIVVPFLFLVAGSASAEVELGAGPNLQVTKGSLPEDGSFATGFLARVLMSTSAVHAWGVTVEGLWLMPTDMELPRSISEQDVLVVNRYRPPVGQRETLAIDLGVGASHFVGMRETWHPTVQLGLSVAAPIARRLVFEFGARLAITPNLFYGDEMGTWDVPRGATIRFGGLLAANFEPPSVASYWNLVTGKATGLWWPSWSTARRPSWKLSFGVIGKVTVVTLPTGMALVQSSAVVSRHTTW